MVLLNPDGSLDGDRMHLNDGHVIHKPVKLLADNEIVAFVEAKVTSPNFLDALEEEVMQQVLSRGDEFITKLVDALMAPEVLPTPGTFPYKYLAPGDDLSEYQCRKHKHHGWCHRMHMLAKYTRIAINYHHARKRLRWEGADKYMHLVCLYGGLKSEARVRYYSAECTCGGLQTYQEFVPNIRYSTQGDHHG